MGNGIPNAHNSIQPTFPSSDFSSGILFIFAFLKTPGVLFANFIN